jgi:superoxide dismutase, Cu-Zn family
MGTRFGFIAALASCWLCAICGNASAEERIARARIVSCTDPSSPLGTATLREQVSDEGVKLIDVHMNLRRGALTPGKHAVHIHETGSCAPCAAAGGHFDPGPSGNSSPEGNHPFHAGDLINVDAIDDGSGVLFTTTNRVTLSAGPLSVFDADGSAIIIHEVADAYCPEGEVAGCAGGARVACGVIRER